METDDNLEEQIDEVLKRKLHFPNTSVETNM